MKINGREVGVFANIGGGGGSVETYAIVPTIGTDPITIAVEPDTTAVFLYLEKPMDIESGAGQLCAHWLRDTELVTKTYGTPGSLVVAVAAQVASGDSGSITINPVGSYNFFVNETYRVLKVKGTL